MSGAATDQSSTLARAPCSLRPSTALLIDRRKPACCSLCVHRSQFDETRLERWERRNANFERVAEMQFLVHCKLNENEMDEEGEKTFLWLTVPEMFNVAGVDREFFDDMFEDFVKKRDDRRNDALSGFE